MLKPKKTILLVDDERHIRIDLSMYLTKRGYFVHTASTIDEAKRIIDHQLIDFAIIDLKLDYMSGYGGIDIFNYAQCNHTQIKFIILSAYLFNEEDLKNRIDEKLDSEKILKQLEKDYIYKGGEKNYILAILDKLEELIEWEINESYVFISYAKEDKVAANNIYNYLKMNGIRAWIDSVDIIPGQNWEYAITRAIENSRYFIAIVSKNSISKIGYVQKELLTALNILDNYPCSLVYIIPVRLDDSEPINQKIRKLHWVDMFPDWQVGQKNCYLLLKS